MASSPDLIAALSQQLDDFFSAQRAQAADFGTEAAMLMDAAADATTAANAQADVAVVDAPAAEDATIAADSDGSALPEAQMALEDGETE